MSVSPPRILVLTKLAPWRLNGGALIRNYWMTYALAGQYTVDLCTAEEAPEPPAHFASRLHTIRQFPRPSGVYGKILRGFDALNPDRPLYAAGSVPNALKAYVSDALKKATYAAIQVDLNMTAALPPNTTIPVLYNAHNCEYALQRRRAEAEYASARDVSARIVPLLMRADLQRLARLETTTLLRSRLIAACSQADVDDLQALLNEQRAGVVLETALAHLVRTVVQVPNGVDTQSYAELPFRGTDPRTLLITGSMDWRPNRMGLTWFLNEILPQLRARSAGKAFAVRIAGRMDEKLIRELQRYPEITAVPNPKRMQDELSRTSIVVAPITASSGTRLRILEAWAAKRPVVTTSHGALGLDYRPEHEIIVRDDPAELATAILGLLDNPDHAERIAAAALERVAQYDWRPIGKQYIQGVERLIFPDRLSAMQ